MVLRNCVVATSLVCVCFLVGCASKQRVNRPGDRHNQLTHGNVQLTLVKNRTTQTEVLNTFGAPNITTIDASGHEVWTYQRHASVATSSSSNVYGTIILFGGSSHSSGFEQSSRTMTLIIKFDKNKRVSDFKSFSSSF